MFIGHWAPALAAAAVMPTRPRLGTLFIAAQLVDWAFFALLLLGVEDMRLAPGITHMNPMDLYHMPYTHSLAGTAAFGAVFAAVVWAWRRDVPLALAAGAVVISHWLIDLLVHRPDLTIAGAPPKLGLGLWDVPEIAMPLELGLTLGALAFYLRRTRGPALPAIVLGLMMIGLQAVNWFGPTPTAVDASISVTAFFAYGVVTLCAWWLGKTRIHRRPGLAPAAPRG
ncbi:hypothetical protein GRI40_02110 [Altererythrobacter aerius]|uniref:Metal-dependent hydrolase n=1 Tax=Tsuneonella aeria TaxID=1837929 RepID=A0A6I4TB79_9SPHN|nr:hypothetical protein [Tsuneonella aeria]MXO74014.1 hypothetical protein [Tsuneonella aeria]